MVWKTILLGQSSSYKGGYYVSEESPWGITDLTQIDTTMVPNSIHQMFARWGYLYVAHYTQGFRMLDISDPENIIELGYYDDFLMINFSPSSNLFFRKRVVPHGPQNYTVGIVGIFPDPNRSTICYAGGFDGFYIFDVTPPPYPPTNFTVTKSEENHPYLQWVFNGDENNIDHYNIYKFLPETGWLYFSQTTNTYFEDNNENYCTLPPRFCTGQHSIGYRVTAVDNSGKESVPSDSVRTSTISAIQQKISITLNNLIPAEYSLEQNYPNPFNPTTRIDYSLAQDAFVTLKVYDMLGNEVTELVNEGRTMGVHNMNFDATELSSGIYIYRVTAMNGERILFSESKRMVLIK